MRRAATARHYLMVRPTYFDVEYSINPWMDPQKPTFTELAVAQWEWLRDLFGELGHTVESVEPRAGLPDMVFSANGATVLNGKVLVARFRHTHRSQESDAYLEWFRQNGYRDVRQAQWINEGEGDYLVAGRHVLAGSGFRTNVRAHDEFEEYFGVPVIGLTLIDPRYYHLDTALAVLGDESIMYYPEAFTAESRELLEELYPDAILACDGDAEAFGLNAVSDGEHVVLPQAATGLMAQLREHGFDPIGVDLSELLKAGGSVKCCTLELRA
ncbi:N-dimethylarginine dimethylaminohydrolase [Kibdelosporangium banguiense]|uniref:N-dimethylarginine dimethylaminohydrolase n=1 Tax=Kibdelosporangium banguiense TaxID=1365924 RepID=A0ABS4TPQ6_9PSEU|nr:dimethylargininase [Kibdelosporangium banguiense]MBP2326389.1 N-dimethylarginine dimethylaminohydrolase [Kibdelosporangium banguiense]